MPVLFNTRIDAILPWIFIIIGAFRLVYGIATYQKSDITINATLALLNLTIGVQLLQSNPQRLLSLALIVGIFLLTEGLSKILFASGVQSSWVGGVFMVSGVVSLLLGSLVWSGILTDVPWLLTAVVGIRIIHTGISNFSIALKSLNS